MVERLISVTSLTSVEYLLSCQVCFEEFEDSGDHVPRILPCGGIVCHTCLEDLISNGKFACPHCNRSHEVPKPQAERSNSVEENKYLQVHIKKKNVEVAAAGEDEDVEPVEKCAEHGKELMFYCRECKQAVCSVCLSIHYKNHEVVEVEEERKHELMRSIGGIKKSLQIRIGKIVPMKEHVGKKTESCIKELEKRKEEMNKQFDKMIKEAKDQMREVKTDIDGEVSALKYNAILLGNIIKSIERDSTGEILRKLEMVGEIEENIDKHLSGPSTYEYLEYDVSNDVSSDVTKGGGESPGGNSLYGSITKKEISVNFSELAQANMAAVAARLSRGNSQETSPLSGQVPGLINTGFDGFCLPHLCLMKDDSVIVFGEERYEWKLKRYNPHGELVDSVVLDVQPYGMAGVMLGGVSTLALSYYSSKRIEFRCVDDMSIVLLSHSTSPHQPWCLTTASPFTLLYQDWSQFPHEVYMLNTGGSTPVPVPNTRAICIEENFVTDMCCVKDWNKSLLIASVGNGEVHAYNTVSSALEWRVQGRLQGMKRVMYAGGVATDGRGHVYVCDSNNECIQKFSVVDGAYVGPVIKEGQQGLGTPWHIRWGEVTSSFAVGHNKEGQLLVSVVKQGMKLQGKG